MKNKNKKIIVLSLILLILVIDAIYLFVYNNEDKSMKLKIDRNDNVTNPIDYKEEIDNLRNEYNNDDVVGILSIDNTEYVVPIMQGVDNDYYLNHTPDGKENFMGSIYLDYRVDIDSSKKILIFGHNSSKIEMPFKILEEFYDKDYYDNHKYVDITTSTTKKRYEIFSVYVETSDFDYMNINFSNEEEYFKHIEKLQSKSMYDTGIELSSDDEILILQTCSTHKDYSNYQKKYLLIILRRVK